MPLVALHVLSSVWQCCSHRQKDLTVLPLYPRQSPLLQAYVASTGREAPSGTATSTHVCSSTSGWIRCSYTTSDHSRASSIPDHISTPRQIPFQMSTPRQVIPCLICNREYQKASMYRRIIRTSLYFRRSSLSCGHHLHRALANSFRQTGHEPYTSPVKHHDNLHGGSRSCQKGC